MNTKTIEKISGAILTSYINLFYLEEVSKTNVFKQGAKRNLKRVLDDLKDIEYKYFNEIEKVDENDLNDKLTANQIIFLDWMLKEFSFNDFTKFQEICYAFKIDPKRVTGITDKILTENNK